MTTIFTGSTIPPALAKNLCDKCWSSICLRKESLLCHRSLALSSDAVWCLSVWRPSDVWRLSVAYIGPKSRKKRPRKTKTGTEVAYVTRDSDTTFKVKRSKVKVTGSGGILWRPSAYSLLFLLVTTDLCNVVSWRLLKMLRVRMMTPVKRYLTRLMFDIIIKQNK